MISGQYGKPWGYKLSLEHGEYIHDKIYIHHPMAWSHGKPIWLEIMGSQYGLRSWEAMVAWKKNIACFSRNHTATVCPWSWHSGNLVHSGTGNQPGGFHPLIWPWWSSWPSSPGCWWQQCSSNVFSLPKIVCCLTLRPCGETWTLWQCQASCGKSLLPNGWAPAKSGWPLARDQAFNCLVTNIAGRHKWRWCLAQFLFGWLR